MAPGRQWHKVLPHFGGKPDMDSRELVKFDPGAHCCFSWDALYFLCSTSCFFPCLPTFPRAAGLSLSFPIFPQSWSFSPFSNANLPDYSSAKTSLGCPGTLAAAWFWGRSKSSGADKFLSLSCCHFLSLTPLLCLRTLLEVAAKPLSILPELSPSCSWWHKAGSGWKDGAAGEAAKMGGSGTSSVWILMLFVFSL